MKIFQDYLSTFKERLTSIESLMEERGQLHEKASDAKASIANPLPIFPSTNLVQLKRDSLTLATKESWSNGKISLKFLEHIGKLLDDIAVKYSGGIYEMTIHNPESVKTHLGITPSIPFSDL